MTSEQREIDILRKLTEEYATIAADPVNDERRELWMAHNGLEKPNRTPILIRFGDWNDWCRKWLRQECQCSDPDYRRLESKLRQDILHASFGDDEVFEPWLSVPAVWHEDMDNPWGNAQIKLDRPDDESGAFHIDPPVKEIEDFDKLMTAPKGGIDEIATAARKNKIEDAVGDIIEIDITRGPLLQNFRADISTHLGYLRGIQEAMMDMCLNPEALHRMLAFMRDAILSIQDAAEENGDFRLSNHYNQAVPYARQLTPPRPNSEPVKRSELWVFCAAQELTLVSPEMHDEFMLQYQLPIISKYGLCAYGCCEDLTKKIDMLRQIPNLRRIAVAPTADVAKCAEQIGDDFVMSWRPSPTDMICGDFDKSRITRIVKEAMAATEGQAVEVNLKDVESVEGDISRLNEWVKITRDAVL